MAMSRKPQGESSTADPVEMDLFSGTPEESRDLPTVSPQPAGEDATAAKAARKPTRKKRVRVERIKEASEAEVPRGPAATGIFSNKTPFISSI